MTEASFFNTVCLIGIALSLLLALFLLTVQTSRKTSNVLFASFLLIFTLDLGGIFSGWLFRHSPSLEVGREQVAFLLMPAFYLYVLSVCYADFRLSPIHLLHLLPFLASNALLLPIFYMAGDAAREQYFTHFNDVPENNWIRISLYLQAAFYLIATFLTLKRFRIIYQQNYTASATMIYQWLSQATILLSGLLALSTIRLLFLFSITAAWLTWLQFALIVAALLLLCWFVLKALYQPVLFRGVDSTLPSVNTLLQTSPHNDTTDISTNTAVPVYQDKINTLKQYMEETAPYLDPELTVQDLARQTGMPARDLSVLINHHLNQHFFDFVNDYRIRKAMSLLEDTAKKERNIQEILYEVGFNSKSSFNTAFKKRTGLTPTQYRNNPTHTSSMTVK
ncbi:helix-turn-helix transcriptional regulator [Chitinophaga pendula]|uniref:helix-turn-helix domain-containing protein n=1 Tax=Chitinophaga TaxID=79328 RepID=UPI000BAF5211|nr:MULTISPECIES: helix-turn-helix transcriptional regulator [Chitinophaga]ASZ14238.1 AraC family transcriptional regulator [Chitinophaga sp. MD30]UCJ08118.1 helix-turn-helix transcriptional regulator [Chitinophaga pendula]